MLLLGRNISIRTMDARGILAVVLDWFLPHQIWASFCEFLNQIEGFFFIALVFDVALNMNLHLRLVYNEY